MLTALSTDWHHALWLEHLPSKFFRPLPNGLVANPVHQLHQLKILQVGTLIDLSPDRVRERFEEKSLDCRIAHAFPELMQEFKPFVQMVIQVLDLAALRELEEFGPARQLDQFI